MVAGGPFGMPRSIVEGMYAGTSVILPDRPEAPLVAGPGCRTYQRAGDIVGHCLEILSGGPDIDRERRRSRRFAADDFADPALATMFTAQLAGGPWPGGGPPLTSKRSTTPSFFDRGQ